VACREIRRRFGLRTFFAHLSVPVDQGGTSSAEGELGMGVHGGHPINDMFFGSTTHHVVRGADCPVLVVRGAGAQGETQG